MLRRIRRWAGRRFDRLAKGAEPVLSGYRWAPVAVLVGTLPFLISLGSGLAGQHVVSAVLLAWLVLGCARSDAWQKGLAVMATAFLAHSLLVLFCAAQWPERAAAVLPHADAYWRQQIAWIETGEDPEYVLSAWLTRHLLLVVLAVLWSLVTVGVQTFQRGFMEVDLMNYYNAQLWNASDQPWTSLFWGWHVWSLLRGVGFLFFTYEMISLALAWWTERELAPWKRRALRLGLAAGFLIADGVSKHLLMEVVRVRLYESLH